MNRVALALALVAVAGLLLRLWDGDTSAEPPREVVSLEADTQAELERVSVPAAEPVVVDARRVALQEQIQAIVDADEVDSEHKLHLLIQTMQPDERALFLELINDITVNNYWQRGQIAFHYRWMEWDPYASLDHALGNWDNDFLTHWFDVLVRRFADLDPAGARNWLVFSPHPVVIEQQQRLRGAAAAGMALHNLPLAQELVLSILDDDIRTSSAMGVAGQFSIEQMQSWENSLPLGDVRDAVAYQKLAQQMEADTTAALDECAEHYLEDPRFRSLMVAGVQHLLMHEPDLGYTYLERLEFSSDETVPLANAIVDTLGSVNVEKARAWTEQMKANGLLPEYSIEDIEQRLELLEN